MEPKKCTFNRFWRGYSAWLAGRRAMSLKDAIAEVDPAAANRGLQKAAIGVALTFAAALAAVSAGEHGMPAQGLSALIGLALAGLIWGAYSGLKRFRRFAAEMCELGRQLEGEASA